MTALRVAGLAAAIVLALGGAAGGGMLTVGADPLGRLLGDDRGATVTNRADGSVLVAAPAGTPVLALGSGRLEARAGAAVRLVGDGDAAGLVVDYGELASPAAAGNRVSAGAAIGSVPASGRLAVSATFDGEALDIGPRLTDGDADPQAPTGTAAGSTAMIRPVAGAVISQLFGCTDFAAEPVDSRCPGGHFHGGIDLAAALGTPVRAALPGHVHVVRTQGGYGLRVELTHAGGLLTLYGHLSSAAVVDGDTVLGGEVIGALGSTGNSTGPHLHFEVRRAGVAEDPRIDVQLP